MTDATAQVSKVSVALSQTEIKIVKKLEKRHGLNFSSALRMIVREWEEHNKSSNGHKPQTQAGETTSAEVKE